MVPAEFDFTSSGVESGFFVPSPGSSGIRITGGLPAPCDGMSGNVPATVLGAEVWVADFAPLSVLGKGITFGEDMGVRAGAGCPESCVSESWSVLTGRGVGVAVLDLSGFP